MSDEKPFAEAYSDGHGDDGWYVVIDGCKLDTSCANATCYKAARINSAVAARERKAAAKALWKASVDLIAAFDGYAHDVSAWLRSRAAALEGGAT